MNKNIISFGIQFLSMFWPLTTHGSIFSSWNSSFIILNFCIFTTLKKINLNKINPKIFKINYFIFK